MSKKLRPQTASSSKFNPFNPYETYLDFVANKTDIKSTSQPFITTVNKSQVTSKHQSYRCQSANKANMPYAALVRFQETKGLKLESQFNEFITKLHKQKNQSVKLLNKVKKEIKDTKNIKGQLSQEKKRQETFLSLLVAQEKVVKSKGVEEQEEFLKHRQKQMRALNIKNFVSKTRKIKVQNDIVEMLRDIKEPGLGNQSKVKYLFNQNRTTSRKQLAKPIFSGIGDIRNKFHHLHKKNPISYNLRECNEMNTNLFFEDQQPFQEFMKYDKKHNEDDEEDMDKQMSSRNQSVDDQEKMNRIILNLQESQAESHNMTSQLKNMNQIMDQVQERNQGENEIIDKDIENHLK